MEFHRARAPATGGRSRHATLTALPSAVPWARRLVQHTLREWQLAGMSDPVLLLVSELVTNAIRACGSGTGRDRGNQQLVITLTLQLTGTRLLAQVWDSGPGRPVLRSPDLAGERGRGLQLVDALADAWGHYPAGDGKVVWCEIGMPRAAG